MSTCGEFGGINGGGKPCGRPAGWGTGEDSGRCMYHPEGRDIGERLDEVAKLAGLGLTQVQIADLFSISDDTLRARFASDPDVARAYKRGRAEWARSTVTRLCDMVNDPEHPKHAAAVFFTLKTQFGWKETAVHEHSGPDGRPIPQAIQVTLVEPDGDG